MACFDLKCTKNRFRSRIYFIWGADMLDNHVTRKVSLVNTCKKLQHIIATLSIFVVQGRQPRDIYGGDWCESLDNSNSKQTHKANSGVCMSTAIMWTLVGKEQETHQKGLNINSVLLTDHNAVFVDITSDYPWVSPLSQTLVRVHSTR